MHPKLCLHSFVTTYPFPAPVKLALCDLWFTNPSERGTEHSFLMYFSPNTWTQSQRKQINQINIYAGSPQCSHANLTQWSSMFIATYSAVRRILHGVCCPVCRQWVCLCKPDLASVLVFALEPDSQPERKTLGTVRRTKMLFLVGVCAVCRGQR